MMTRTAADPGFLARCRDARCRSCGQRGLQPVLDLGRMPHSDGLLTPDQVAGEQKYPLEVAFCSGCSLVQILETVAPEVLFGADYPYFSSFSDSWVEHARRCAEELIERRGLGAESLVVEVASNDGYLLRHFVARGVPVLGIDPAPGPAAAAARIGVETLNEFFGLDLARRLRAAGKTADVILGNNVLAHVADTNGFVAGLRELLADDGVISIEVPYLRDLIDKRAFDTIYHEHLCYFSLTALDRLFRRHRLYVNEVRRLPTHGGSLRILVAKHEAVAASVGAILAEERRLGMDRIDYYGAFAARVHELGVELRRLLGELSQQGRSIAAYGAAAKGAILLNFVGDAARELRYVVDRNVHKQGRLMPGVHLPIVDPAVLAADPPDYLLILPWNLTDEIVGQQQGFAAAGGRFIVPVPEPRIIDRPA